MSTNAASLDGQGFEVLNEKQRAHQLLLANAAERGCIPMGGRTGIHIDCATGLIQLAIRKSSGDVATWELVGGAESLELQLFTCLYTAGMTGYIAV